VVVQILKSDLIEETKEIARPEPVKKEKVPDNDE
jgi:hypothetical protein